MVQMKTSAFDYLILIFCYMENTYTPFQWGEISIYNADKL